MRNQHLWNLYNTKLQEPLALSRFIMCIYENWKRPMAKSACVVYTHWKLMRILMLIRILRLIWILMLILILIYWYWYWYGYWFVASFNFFIHVHFRCWFRWWRPSVYDICIFYTLGLRLWPCSFYMMNVYFKCWLC